MAPELFKLSPGSSRLIDIAVGPYRIAAEIPNSSIMPFYGEQTFAEAVAYSKRFYIGTAPR